MDATSILIWALIVAAFVIFCMFQSIIAKSPKLYLSLILPLISLGVVGFYYYRSTLPTSEPNMSNGFAMMVGLILFVSSVAILLFVKIRKYLEDKNEWK